MKYLLLVLLFVSCSSHIPIRRTFTTVVDRMEKCVFRLVEKNGVSAIEAQKVCDKIYRRK